MHYCPSSIQAVKSVFTVYDCTLLLKYIVLIRKEWLDKDLGVWGAGRTNCFLEKRERIVPNCI